MSKIRKRAEIGPPVQVGDLAINWYEWLSDDENEDFIKRTEHDMAYAPSDTNYVFGLRLQEITKLQKGRFFIKSPHMPFIEKSKTNWIYNRNRIKSFNRDLYNRLMQSFPLKGKIGDKIINPYMVMKDQDIIDCKEDKYNFSNYELSPLNAEVDLEHNRPSLAKSLPYLEIIDINSEVFYNIKYKKYLFTINHYYECCMKNNDVQITVSVGNERLQHYENFNGIWNNVCMSPSQEI